MSDYKDYNEEDGICPECGSILESYTVNENTDRDGNRGRLVTYVECRNPDCEYETAF